MKKGRFFEWIKGRVGNHSGQQSISENAGRWLAMRTFSADDRLTLYEDLAFLLENHLRMEDAIEALIVSAESPNHPSVFCLKDIKKALNQGLSIDKGLSGWIPPQEEMLLSAGVQDGRPAAALRRAIKVTQATGEMKSVFLSTLSYPLLLLVASWVMMVMVDQKFLPRLATLVPESQWEGALWWLALLSRFFSQHIFVLLLAFVLAVAGILWSLPNLTGEIRRRVLDRLLPWSLYRDIQGVSFLLNFTALMRAQVKTQDALLLIAHRASPWLYERISAVLIQIQQGKHLGLALRDSGYAFPAKKAVNKLVILTGGDNAEDIIENYTYDWLEKTVKRIKKFASIISYIALSINAGYMVLILLSTQNLNNLISVR